MEQKKEIARMEADGEKATLNYDKNQQARENALKIYQADGKKLTDWLEKFRNAKKTESELAEEWRSDPETIYLFYSLGRSLKAERRILAEGDKIRKIIEAEAEIAATDFLYAESIVDNSSDSMKCKRGTGGFSEPRRRRSGRHGSSLAG